MAEKETQETIFTCRFTINLAAYLTRLCNNDECPFADRECPCAPRDCDQVTVADWVQALKDKVR